MGLEERVLAKLSVKELGQHLSNYIDLYLSPLAVWRKIIGNRSSSYNLVILHIIYYSFFVLLVAQKPYGFSLLYVVIELGITIIPFLIFFLPFKLFTRLFNKKIKWNRLFRLFIILKLQFLPIFISIVLFARWSESEAPYTIIENLIWVLWIALIIVMPLLVAIKSWQKVLWIFVNYICFLFFLILFSSTVSRFVDLEATLDKVSITTPNNEFRSFQIQSPHSEMFIENDYVLLILKKPKNESLQIVRTQFVTLQLLASFKITEANQARRRLVKADSLRRTKDTINISKTWIDSLTVYPTRRELSLAKLDTLKDEFDKMFDLDFELTKKLKDSAIFESNRRYFQSLHKYLDNYQRLFSDLGVFYKASKNENAEIVFLEDDYYASLNKIDSLYYVDIRTDYKTNENELERRAYKADFMSSLVLYPLHLISDYGNDED